MTIVDEKAPEFGNGHLRSGERVPAVCMQRRGGGIRSLAISELIYSHKKAIDGQECTKFLCLYLVLLLKR